MWCLESTPGLLTCYTGASPLSSIPRQMYSFCGLNEFLQWYLMSQLLFCCCEEMPWPRPLLKRTHLIGDLLTVSEVSPLSSWKGAGRRGAGEGAESYSWSAERRRHWLLLVFLKPQKPHSDTLPTEPPTPARPCLLILILSNRATSWWLIIQIYAPVRTSPIQTTTVFFILLSDMFSIVITLGLGGKDKHVPLSLRYRQIAGRCVD